MGRVLNNPPKNFFYFVCELSKRKYIRGGFLTILQKTSFILFVNCQKENIFGGGVDRKIYSGRVLNNPPKNFFYFVCELSKRKYIRGWWIEKYIRGGFLTNFSIQKIFFSAAFGGQYIFSFMITSKNPHLWIYFH